MKYKQRKKEEKAREEMLMALPTFINRLLLMLNSGMVLQEAMVGIALNYKAAAAYETNGFALSFVEIYESSEKTGENFLKNFCRFGRESHVKELARVAKIIADGDKKGIDLWDKLADEGENLWEERKRIALEKIRIAESKMSFPLGILLMALILITAAPAMLQMYIN